MWQADLWSVQGNVIKLGVAACAFTQNSPTSSSPGALTANRPQWQHKSGAEILASYFTAEDELKPGERQACVTITI